MNTYSKLKNKILILILGIILPLGYLYAQPNQNQQRPPAFPDSSRIVQMVNELAASLSLSEDQKTKVSDLHFNHFAEAKELMVKDKDDSENHRKAMYTLRQEFEVQIKTLLSDEQKNKFEIFIKNHGPQKDRKRQ